MHPRYSARASRRPAAGQVAGFTLVELLVVIAIIGMLVGLLIPAVQRAREAARRNTCLNNQGQLGKAIMGYVTSRDKFPPLYSMQPPGTVGDPNNPTAVGWVPPILPNIEQNNLYNIFQQNTWNTLAPTATSPIPPTKVATLICPSRNPTFGFAPLSYIVNAGMRDRNPPNTTNGLQLDFRENGVFFDAFTPKLNFNPKVPETTIDLAYLSKHDGTTKTLMLSENLDALDWINLTAGNPGGLFPAPNSDVPSDRPPTNPLLFGGQCWWQAFIWWVDQNPGPNWGTAGIFPSGQILNKTTSLPLAQVDYVYGRPSSTHPGGFIVTFCGGNTQFMGDDIEYRVYCLLMAPENSPQALANAQRDPNNMSFKYPDNWFTTPVTPTVLIPLNDGDVQ